MSIVAHFMPVSGDAEQRIRSGPAESEALVTEGDLPVVEIDQAWAGIAFVLTGHDEDDGTILSQAIFGGTPVVEDFGTGPIRLLAAAETKAISSALAQWSELEFRRKCDEADLRSHEIYPGTWDSGTTCDYLVRNFAKLQDVYKQAAERSEAMLAWLA